MSVSESTSHSDWFADVVVATTVSIGDCCVVMIGDCGWVAGWVAVTGTGGVST